MLLSDYLSLAALILTVVIALAAGYSAWMGRRAAQASESAAKITEKSTQAIYVSDTFKEYEKLVSALKETRDWEDDHKDHIALYKDLTPEKDNSDILRNYPLPNKVWKKSRKVKMFFKRHYGLYHDSLITEKTLLTCINRFGYDLLHDVVFPMDKFRYFDVRKDRRINEDEYNAEFQWYFTLTNILKRYNP